MAYEFDNAFVDVVNLTDFRLVCETDSRKVEYLFRNWTYDADPAPEINGGISQLYGMAQWRKEIAKAPEFDGHEE